MDRFSFIFAFYGLILGLAVTELLGGFGKFVSERRFRDIQAQTALLAVFVFLDICATWIDAWSTLRDISLNYHGLWAPVLLATSYYLAAAVVFPRNPAEFEQIDRYYERRKGFVATMLLVAELLVGVTYLPYYRDSFDHRPAVFWLFDMPIKIIILALLVALILVKGRKRNIAVLVALIVVFTIPYWSYGALSSWVHERFDTPAGGSPTANQSPSGSS